MIKRFLLALVLMLGGLTVACQPVGAASCAWTYSTQDQPTRYDWPDSNASYWSLSFTSAADLTITVHGNFPDARYMSLSTYNAWGTAGPADEIHDSQIVPNADGSYTVTVSHTPGVNTIPFANAVNGVTGYLLYRIYLPNGNPQPPAVTMTTSAGSTDYAPCVTETGGGVGIFNNPDSAYSQYSAPYPAGGTVAVISGKAPDAVRYWSWCSYAASSAVVDCKYDAQAQLTAGRYHLVVGQSGQKTAILAAGYTYLQYAGLLQFRNILGDQMSGDYAPVVHSCALTDRACILQ